MRPFSSTANPRGLHQPTNLCQDDGNVFVDGLLARSVAFVGGDFRQRLAQHEEVFLVRRHVDAIADDGFRKITRALDWRSGEERSVDGNLELFRGYWRRRSFSSISIVMCVPLLLLLLLS